MFLCWKHIGNNQNTNIKILTSQKMEKTHFNVRFLLLLYLIEKSQKKEREVVDHRFTGGGGHNEKPLTYRST
ncbi:hypothetical protein C7R94_28180 [Brevibacillus sp. NRRL NRS-603]|nr:hypothetical protein C7R94_28180 [Brevibacillus sp. NRRL NRS-603]